MNSSEYFAKRSERRMKRMHDKATNSMAKINKSYDESIKRLKEEINHIVGNVEGLSPTEVNTHMLKKIDYDRYQELLEQYHKTTNPRIRSKFRNMLKENAASYRIERKEALIRAIEAEKLRQTDKQLTEGKNHLEDVYKTVNRELGTPDIDRKRLKEVLNHEWAGSNFSKRVWHNQEVLAKNIETNLMESFISGKSNREIARELESQTDLGRFAANRLIRTETSYMVNSADLDSSKKRGIKAKKFEATLDSRTSKVCKKHNQKIIPIDKIKIGENAPPLHPFCRSFLADVLEGWDYESEEELEKMISDEYKGGDLKRETNANLNRIGKNHSINSIEKLNKISKSSIINMKNTDAIKKYIKENYSIDIVNFDSLDLEKSKIIFSGLDDVIKKYPDVKNSLNSVIFDEGITQDGILRGLNIHIGENGLNYETISHELAHVMDKERSSGNVLDYSQGILKKTRRKLKLRKNSKEYERLAYEIVGYDKRNANLEEEIFAYSFETENTNSQLGNRLSKAIMEEINVFK